MKMLANILSKFREEPVNDQFKTQRIHERRASDELVSVVNGTTYPVENWSMGGVLIQADSRPFGIDNEVEITLRFRLQDQIMNIAHRARVVRKSHDTIAMRFAPITKQIRDQFQSVVDDFVTRQFASSQHLA